MPVRVPLSTESGHVIEAIVRVNADWPQMTYIKTWRDKQGKWEGVGDDVVIGRIECPSGPDAWMEVEIRHRVNGQGDWVENDYRIFQPVFNNEIWTLGSEDNPPADSDYNDCTVGFFIN